MVRAIAKASFPRRLGAMLYDSILVLAILIVGTCLLHLIMGGKNIEPGNLYYQIYLLFLIGCFFSGFWIHGGQTAGMVAWRIKVTTLTNEPISIQHALLRLLFALPSLLLGGCGLLWMLYDPDQLTLYDRWSKTKLISIS